MAAVVADKVVTVLQADVDQYIAGINSAQSNFASKLALMQTEAQQMGTVMDIAGRNSTKAFTAINQNAPKAAAAIKGVSGELKYLPAQLNDIAVQLAGGQSPFLIAVQQGSQINQALGGLGARGAVTALAGAFTSLINPVNLAVFALIAAGGAAVQYFSSVVEGGDKSEAQLKKEAELIANVAAKWGDLLPAVRDYQDAKDKALDLSNIRTATNATITNFFADARKSLTGFQTDFADVVDQLSSSNIDPSLILKAQTAFIALKKAIDENRDSSKETLDLQNTLSDVYAKLPLPALQKFQDGIDGIAKSWKDVADRATEARIEQDKAIDLQTPIFDPRDPRFQGPTGPLPTNAPTPDARPSFEDVGQSLDSLNNAIDAFTNRVVKAESGGNPNAKNPNSSATGTGQFIESTWLNLFRKYYPEQAANLSRDAILDLRKNADYSYALIQAYARENAKVLSAAGVHVDEAALQLAHFLGAGDAAKVLNAASGTPLAGLISAKSIAANPTILGGGRTTDDAIAYANRRASSVDTETKKTPAEIFKGKTDDVQKRIDALNAEVAAQNKLNPLVKDYGYQVEQAKIKAELLNEAQQAGLKITPELSASIDEYATNLAKATAARAQLTEAQKYAAEAVKQGSEFGKDVLGGFIRDLRDGKTAADALADALEKIADKLLDSALNSAFDLGPGGTGGGGPLSFLGAIFSGLFKASGGPVRKGQPYIVGEKRAELFIPDSNGTIMPSVPNIATPSRGVNSGGGALTVQSTVGVVNGELVPLMTQVSGVVAGQQVKQASKASPSRLNSYQSRGT